MAIPSFQQYLFVARALRTHVRRLWWCYGLAAAVFVWTSAHFRIAINLSDSLPQSLYLVDLDVKPTRVGEFVAFKWRRHQFYRPEWIFVKRVAGVPGQAITVTNRSVFIDGKRVGYAKPNSRQGVPLAPISPGVIPAGYVYAEAPHPDSLDSRYQVTGLIESARIIGTAYAIF
jgi:conjugal transfer pilin signal peptidase TrbI